MVYGSRKLLSLSVMGALSALSVDMRLQADEEDGGLLGGGGGGSKAGLQLAAVVELGQEQQTASELDSAFNEANEAYEELRELCGKDASAASGEDHGLQGGTGGSGSGYLVNTASDATILASELKIYERIGDKLGKFSEKVMRCLAVLKRDARQEAKAPITKMLAGTKEGALGVVLTGGLTPEPLVDIADAD